MGTEFQPAEADPRTPEYARASNSVTRLTCFSFYLAGILALFALGRRLAGTDKALTLVAVYACSSYVLGLGSDGPLSCGLVYISHVAPSAMTLLALLALPRPAVAGVLLAAAAGVLFYPAFLLPLFLGWYGGQGRGVRAFSLGFAGAGLAIGLLVFACTASLGDQGPVELFLESTLEHQEGTAEGAYGDSKFSFWGSNHPDWKEIFQQPLVGDSSLFKLSFLLVAGFSLLGYFLARRRSAGAAGASNRGRGGRGPVVEDARWRHLRDVVPSIPVARAAHAERGCSCPRRGGSRGRGGSRRADVKTRHRVR